MNSTTENTELNIRWLDPAAVRAAWDLSGVRLTVTIGDEPPIREARAVQAFPISRSDEFIQLSDEKGERGGMLRSLAGLSSETLAAVKSALAARYLIPRVKRLLDLVERSHCILRWHVDTSRGERVFFTESAREAAHNLGPDWLRVTDLEGNQFDFPGVSGMDAESRKRLAYFF